MVQAGDSDEEEEKEQGSPLYRKVLSIDTSTHRDSLDNPLIFAMHQTGKSGNNRSGEAKSLTPRLEYDLQEQEYWAY